MGHSGDTTQTGAKARDPFAPPPEGAPDRPWKPRGPVTHTGLLQAGGPGEADGEDTRPDGDGGRDGRGDDTPRDGEESTPRPGDDPFDADGPDADGPAAAGAPGTPGPRSRAQVPPPHPWSPGYQGQQPPMPRFPYPPQGPRYDPNDPIFRRSRLALLCGMWGFFFMVLGVPYITLLLGALALYWGISALRGALKPQPAPNAALAGPAPAPAPSATPYYPSPSVRPHVPAALGGVIAGAVSLALVAVVFGVQLYYKSYYDCQANALTKASYDTCATSVSPRPPAWLVQLNGS